MNTRERSKHLTGILLAETSKPLPLPPFSPRIYPSSKHSSVIPSLCQKKPAPLPQRLVFLLPAPQTVGETVQGQYCLPSLFKGEDMELREVPRRVKGHSACEQQRQALLLSPKPGFCLHHSASHHASLVPGPSKPTESHLGANTFKGF